MEARCAAGTSHDQAAFCAVPAVPPPLTTATQANSQPAGHLPQSTPRAVHAVLGPHTHLHALHEKVGDPQRVEQVARAGLLLAVVLAQVTAGQGRQV